MTARLAALLGALIGGLGVAFGAFGAHALKARLDPGQLATFETGVRYQMYHAFALLAAAWLLQQGARGAGAAATAFTAGVVLFSGSLYVLALTGARWAGPVTPLGGVAFLIGWILLARAAASL